MDNCKKSSQMNFQSPSGTVFNSTPATTSREQFCCSIVALVSVSLPPPPSCWQNFGSGNLQRLKIALQRKKSKQTKISQISFLICFSLWRALSPWIIVPAWLTWVVQAGKKKASFSWYCLQEKLSVQLQWESVASGAGVSLSVGSLLLTEGWFCWLDSSSNQGVGEDWWLGGEVDVEHLLWVIGVFLATSEDKGKCRQ